MTKVFIAKNDTQLSPAQLAGLCRQLPQTVTGAAGRYRRWQDAQAFLWGRYLLQQGLHGFGIKHSILPELQYTIYKRPYLPGPFDFNIAHSGNYILCAISTGTVGIDIEAIRPVEINDFASCFSVSEMAAIKNAPDSYDCFFTYWTIKEAVIKADGRGLSLPLETIAAADKVVIGEKTWLVHRLDIADGYRAHLATGEDLTDGILTEIVSLPSN